MTLIAKPYTRTMICLLPIAGALLNLDLFGPQTLAAYFTYTFFASVTAMIAAGRLLGNVKRFPPTDLPAPILLFIALTLFIFLHGLITHTLNLTHYYWVANAALFWGAWSLGGGRLLGAGSGVSLLALFQSLVICCQQLGFLSSKNPLYACTGTWENPNVTAMFLSLAVYSVLQGIRRSRAAYVILLFILLALLLLQCRTAIIVTAVFLIGHNWARLNTFIKSKTRLPGRVMAVMAGGVLVTAILLLAFGVKRVSSQGRIRIWEASIRLIGQKPFTGQGFGRFEKQYNLFAAKEAL